MTPKCKAIGETFQVGDRLYTLIAQNPDRYSVSVAVPFGEYLQRWRIANGVTQTALGRLIGYSQKQVSRFERGETTVDAGEFDRVRGVLSGWEALRYRARAHKGQTFESGKRTKYVAAADLGWVRGCIQRGQEVAKLDRAIARLAK